MSTTNVTKNASGSRVVFTTSTGSVSAKYAGLGATPNASTIRFTGENFLLLVAYTDLQINGVQVYTKDDAKAKLVAYIPDITILASETPVVLPKRYNGVHLVMSLFHQDYTGSSVTAFVQMLKDCGINVLWLHNDDYDPANAYYKTNTLAVIAACASIGGIWCAPGLLYFADTGANTCTKKMKDLITDTIYLPGMLKIDGIPVYMNFGWMPFVSGGGATYDEKTMQALLLSAEGIHKIQYMNIIQVNYSYSWDNRVTWQGESTSNGMKKWSIRGFFSVKSGVSPDFAVTDMDHEITEHNTNSNLGIDGFVNFSVDTPLSVNRADNLHKARIVKARKLRGGHWAGWAGFYASFSIYNYGFAGMENSWDDMLALSLDDRPLGMMAITGNDDIEYSRCTPMPGFSFGLKYVPSAGTYIGNTLPTPVLNRRGMIDYLKPRIDAFLYDRATPVYYTNRIFCWYMLHPRGAAFIATIPSGMTDLGFIQSQWNSMIYAVGNGTVTLIKGLAGVDDICMGAHIIQPCYLKINSTLSTLFTPPVGGMSVHFQIAIGSFTGVPVFSIIDTDGTTVIKTGSGQQAISTSCWPGGWGILCEEV